MWPVRPILLALALSGWGWLYERDPFEARFILVGPNVELRAFSDGTDVLAVGHAGEWGWFIFWSR